MQQDQLIFRQSIINYHVFGKGERCIFCFHGYGEDGRSFQFLEQWLGERYTLIAMDLPFHGATEWREGLNFSIEDLSAIMDLLLVRNGKAGAMENKRFSLAGFSLGGRMALSVYQYLPQRVERMVMLAPDGLKMNRWYWISTQTWLGNKFFSFTMKHPSWFFGFLKMMNKLGFVNASVFKFVKSYIGNEIFRKQLYCRWTSLRKLRPRLGEIRKLIRESGTLVRLIYGRHDRIILPSVGMRFRKGIEKECELTILDSGHQVLQNRHAAQIVEAIEGRAPDQLPAKQADID